MFCRPYRVLDTCVIACAAVPLLQLIPVSAAWRHAISPRIDDANAFFFSNFDRTAPQSLSLWPTVTFVKWLIGIELVLLFWTCRSMFAKHGLRLVARTVCWTGCAMSIAAVMIRPTSYRGLIYGVSRPIQRAAYGPARPYGPLVDPSDTACWLVMAIALSMGYLVARAQERPLHTDASDTRTLWIAGAIVMMFVALIGSLSRSGAVGLLVAFLVGAVTTASTSGRRGRLWLVAIAAAALVIAILVPRTDALAAKFESARPDWSGGRIVIWAQTLPIIRRFWLVGVGAGAYPWAMEIYQQSHPDILFDEAHNQILQS